MINRLDFISFEYEQIQNILLYLYNNAVAKDGQGNPNISMTATDRVLSYLKQDQKTGLVKYPFITYQIMPNTVVDTGGSYDYAISANSQIQISFYDQTNDLLYKQNIPIRVQPDYNSLNINLWTYSYQQQAILRDLTNRYFTLPKRINQQWDITQTIINALNLLQLDIDTSILEGLQINYLIPFYMVLQSQQDTTPISIQNELPIKQFTYSINYDTWVPTDIELDQIIGIIEEISVNYFTGQTNPVYIDTSVTNQYGTGWNQNPKTIISNYYLLTSNIVSLISIYQIE